MSRPRFHQSHTTSARNAPQKRPIIKGLQTSGFPGHPSPGLIEACQRRYASGTSTLNALRAVITTSTQRSGYRRAASTSVTSGRGAQASLATPSVNPSATAAGWTRRSCVISSSPSPVAGAEPWGSTALPRDAFRPRPGAEGDHRRPRLARRRRKTSKRICCLAWPSPAHSTFVSRCRLPMGVAAGLVTRVKDQRWAGRKIR